MLNTALKANGVATEVSVVSVFGAPTVPNYTSVLRTRTMPVICTDADHRTVRTANASWLSEQKTTGFQTFAPKHHSQRERPT